MHWCRLCLVLILFEPAWAVYLECNNDNIPFYYAAQAGICCACELQKGHCYWVTPKGIFNDKNKGKIQIIVDKVGRVKTKQWESADSVSFFCPLLQFPLLCFLSCVFTLMAFHLSHSIKTFSIVHLLYGSEWKRISMLYSSHCITSVCAPNKDQCTTESA